MMRSLRETFGLLLATLIVITAVHVGAARGQAQVAGSIVLCTGGGPVTVSIDADGQPVGPLKTCPDCVVSILSGLDAPVLQMLHAVRLQRLVFGRSRVPGRAHRARKPPARGPPRMS